MAAIGDVELVAGSDGCVGDDAVASGSEVDVAAGAVSVVEVVGERV